MRWALAVCAFIVFGCAAMLGHAGVTNYYIVEDFAQYLNPAAPLAQTEANSEGIAGIVMSALSVCSAVVLTFLAATVGKSRIGLQFFFKWLIFRNPPGLLALLSAVLSAFLILGLTGFRQTPAIEYSMKAALISGMLGLGGLLSEATRIETLSGLRRTLGPIISQFVKQESHLNATRVFEELVENLGDPGLSLSIAEEAFFISRKQSQQRLAFLKFVLVKMQDSGANTYELVKAACYRIRPQIDEPDFVQTIQAKIDLLYGHYLRNIERVRPGEEVFLYVREQFFFDALKNITGVETNQKLVDLYHYAIARGHQFFLELLSAPEARRVFPHLGRLLTGYSGLLSLSGSILANDEWQSLMKLHLRYSRIVAYKIIDLVIKGVLDPQQLRLVAAFFREKGVGPPELDIPFWHFEEEYVSEQVHVIHKDGYFFFLCACYVLDLDLDAAILDVVADESSQEAELETLARSVREFWPTDASMLSYGERRFPDWLLRQEAKLSEKLTDLAKQRENALVKQSISRRRERALGKAIRAALFRDWPMLRVSRMANQSFRQIDVQVDLTMDKNLLVDLPRNAIDVATPEIGRLVQQAWFGHLIRQLPIVEFFRIRSAGELDERLGAGDFAVLASRRLSVVVREMLVMPSWSAPAGFDLVADHNGTRLLVKFVDFIDGFRVCRLVDGALPMRFDLRSVRFDFEGADSLKVATVIGGRVAVADTFSMRGVIFDRMGQASPPVEERSDLTDPES